jgi:hypothetical protein
MASYTTAQLNIIRTYLGYGYQIDFEPEVEQALLATQAQGDGGGQPDTALQLQLLSYVSLLANIDQQLTNLDNITFVQTSSSGSKINIRQGKRLLKRQGREYIKRINIIIGLQAVKQDYYSGTEVNSSPTSLSQLYEWDLV